MLLACQPIQRWSAERLLREKEATALAEEDYELAEMLSQQLDTTRVKPQQDLVSTGLIEVHRYSASSEGVS